MNTFESALKYLRTRQNLTQLELAEKLGMSKSIISMYENGNRKPDFETLEKIADFFNVSMNFLMGRDSADTIPPFNAQASLIELPDSVLIPVYGKIAAGVPIEAIEDIQEYIDIPADWVKTGKKFIGLTVEGDSMYPKLWEGDIVVIEVTPDANSGDICAVYVNGYEATLKTIKLSGENITLSPFNTVYPPKTYKREEIGILGVVRELRRKM